MKKALVIINPCAGLKKANKYLTDIVDTLTKNDYIPTVLTTTRRGDGTAYIKNYADEHDLVVAIGGDGTFNEIVEGMVEDKCQVPIGYIPAGSTNDFAQSLKLSTKIDMAAVDIAVGEPVPFDVGRFNGRCFTYVACFGAFSKASYDTPQNVKNAVGHLAYILSGINTIASIQPEHMKIVCDPGTENEKCYEDDFLFGAITNATSFGGVLKYKQDMVDMGDGKFEILLVKMPHDPIELAEIIRRATTSDFEGSDLFVFAEGKKFSITSSVNTDWSLDGEYQKGTEHIEIENLYHAIRLMMRPKRKNKNTSQV